MAGWGMNRRAFTALSATAASALSVSRLHAAEPVKGSLKTTTLSGLGGVAIGNGFKPTTDEEAAAALKTAWEHGVRMFDTAPFYGFGLSERRFGRALSEYPREEFMLSTKVGRLLRPDPDADGDLWKDVPPFSPVVDYSASATRRSIEDSLQRLGLSSIDIAFIHDLSPDFLGDEWEEKFEIARKGAMPELTKMREEGLIKGWGFGVNTLPPLLRAMEVADPDIFLSACQYSLVYHEEALEKLLPKCEENQVSIVVGAPLNFGFLAGRDRYNYGGTIPDGMLEKRSRMNEIAREHDVDLRTAALQFSAAPAQVVAVIPGARDAKQAEENAKSFKAKIPSEFWEKLESEKLIASNAPVPTAG